MGIYPGQFKMGFEPTFKKQQNRILAYLLVREGFFSRHGNWALWQEFMEQNPAVVLMELLHSMPNSCHGFPLRIHWKAVCLLPGIFFLHLNQEIKNIGTGYKQNLHFGAIWLDYKFVIIESATSSSMVCVLLFMANGAVLALNSAEETPTQSWTV